MVGGAARADRNRIPAARRQSGRTLRSPAHRVRSHGVQSRHPGRPRRVAGTVRATRRDPLADRRGRIRCGTGIHGPRRHSVRNVLQSRPPIEQAKSRATMTDKFHSTVLPQIADGTPYTAVDVFGPTLEFISGPDDPGADFCVMRGVVPPGVAVPLHSHNDAEEFFITTTRLGRFFQEVARTGVTHPPTPAELAEFVALATKYGYDLGTPEQNAAIGIALSF